MVCNVYACRLTHRIQPRKASWRVVKFSAYQPGTKLVVTNDDSPGNGYNTMYILNVTAPAASPSSPRPPSPPGVAGAGSRASSRSKAGIAAGISVGCVAFIAVIMAVWIFRKRKMKLGSNTSLELGGLVNGSKPSDMPSKGDGGNTTSTVLYYPFTTGVDSNKVPHIPGVGAAVNEQS